MAYRLRALLAALIVAPLWLSAQSESFRLGYFELPPHTQNEAGSAGPALHYFDKIAARMQVEVRYLPMPLSRLLKQLENNELDAALILAKSPDRQQLFIYPQQAFFITQGALTVRKSIPSNLNAFLKNQNYRVALSQQGYQSEQLRSFAGRFVMLSGDNVSARAAEMMEKGRLDAFYEPDIYSLRHSIEHNTFGSALYILELPQDQVPLYTVFSRQGAEKYLQSYQQALQQQAKELGYIDYLTQWLKTQAAVAKPLQQKHP